MEDRDFPEEDLDEKPRRKHNGKDDMNLVELSFASLDDRGWRGKVVRIEYKSKDKKTGGVKRCYKEIKGNPKLGLPTFFEEEIYIALMELTNRYGFEKPTVPATKYEILKIMGRSTGGDHLKRLKDGMSRLKMVSIETNDFWDNEVKEYMTVHFGIVSNYGFYEDERRGRRSRYREVEPPIKGFFSWDSFLFENSFLKSFIKSLNTEVYFSLRLPLSKRLYRYGDKHIEKGPHSIDLFKLAHVRLGVSKNFIYPSKVIEVLKPAIKELTDRRLMDIAIAESQTESGHKVMFRPLRKRQIFIPRKTDGGEQVVPPEQTEEGPLISELRSCGVTDRDARCWVEEHGEDKLRAALESLRFNLEQGRKIVSKGGWLRKHLEESWEQPSGVQEQKKRKEDEQKLRAEQEARWRMGELKKEYERWMEKEREEFWNGVPDRSQMEAEALRVAREKHDFRLKHLSDQEAKSKIYYQVELNRLIDERAGIPNLEEWMEQRGIG